MRATARSLGSGPARAHGTGNRLALGSQARAREDARVGALLALTRQAAGDQQDQHGQSITRDVLRD